MVEQTPNLKLDMDAGTDYYNIGKFNGNFQKIDTFASTIGGEVDDFLQQLSLRYTKEEIDAFLANKANLDTSLTWITSPLHPNIIYAKDKSNGVFVSGYTNIAGTLIGGHSIGTVLPVGFRPNNYIVFTGSFYTGGGNTVYAVPLQVTPDGVVSVPANVPTLSGTVLWFGVYFKAIN